MGVDIGAGGSTAGGGRVGRRGTRSGRTYPSPTTSTSSVGSRGTRSARSSGDPYAARRDSAGRTGFGDRTLPFDVNAPGGLGDHSRALRAGNGSNGSNGSNGGNGGNGSNGGTGTGTGTDTNGDGEITDDERTDMGDDTLNATLAAIEAEFGMTKQQLLNDDGESGRQYRQILAGMQQQKRDDLEATRDDLVARGILRSGETLENETRLQRGYAQNVAAAQGDRDLKLADSAAQRATLGPKQAAAEATATADHERRKRDYEAMLALSNGGL